MFRPHKEMTAQFLNVDIVTFDDSCQCAKMILHWITSYTLLFFLPWYLNLHSHEQKENLMENSVKPKEIQ